jgi:Icc protein
MNRKQFLSTLSVAGTASALASNQSMAATENSTQPLFRMAHMTDPHIYPGNNAPEQIAQAIRHMHSPNMKVDEILCGGDCIMDALKVSKEDTRTQWKLWQDVIEAEVNLPFHTCIGNHDVWGWAMKEGQKDKGEYGKKWAMDELGLQERYYHFTRNNWDFLVLDSVYTSFQTSRGYTAKLDDEQFAWLEGKLQDIPKNRHICVLSHIPILCLSSFFDGPNEKSGNWVVPHEWMHIDARRIKTLFHQPVASHRIDTNRYTP